MTDFTIYTKEYIEASQLNRIPDTIDKREGSIIYDTTSPVSAELATYYTNLTEAQKQTYAKTATGDCLDLKVAEAGISRKLATYAQKLITLCDENSNPISVANGTRFSTITTDTPLNFAVIAPYIDTNGNKIEGKFVAQCETVGTIGNSYAGNILPIDFVSGLATSTMSTLINPAEDDEDDESLRARYFDKISQKSFGGNLAQYREYFGTISGVGCAQIYPVWNGGGTVKASILDASYNNCSNDFIAIVQNIIDPNESGHGIGYAPIDHKVTVTTPSNVAINISANISLNTGYAKDIVQNNINTALNNYLLSLRKIWAIPQSDKVTYTLCIYVAKVSAILMSADGVANVTNVEVNGSTSDLILSQTAQVQQIPITGTNTFNIN